MAIRGRRRGLLFIYGLWIKVDSEEARNVRHLNRIERKPMTFVGHYDESCLDVSAGKSALKLLTLLKRHEFIVRAVDDQEWW